MRAVLDLNVLIASLLAPSGAPAQLLLRWLAGDFELIVSDKLMAELSRALAHSKVRERVSPTDAAAFVELLDAAATRMPDPAKPLRRSRDAGDDYVLALAENCSAIVVSGDRDLLQLSGDFPVHSPAGFLATLVS